MQSFHADRECKRLFPSKWGLVRSMSGESVVKFGVVFQGPLLSQGRSGATIDVHISDVRAADIVSHDCISTIEATINGHKGAIDDFVVVIWDDESPERVARLEKIVGPDHILSIKDNTRPIVRKDGLLAGNNKLKQFYSTLAGVRALRERGCDLVAKIRSDQVLDVTCLRTDWQNMTEPDGAPERLLVPAFVRGNPRHILDFYFVANILTFEDYLADYLRSSEIQESVHADIFYRFAGRGGARPIVPLSWIPGLKGTVLEANFSLKAWQQIFSPGSRKVYSTLQWRGETLPQSHIEKYMFWDDLNAEKQIPKSEFQVTRSWVRPLLRCTLNTLAR